MGIHSGKTAICIELSKRLLASQPAAKVLVLVPTVMLAGQQSSAFEVAGFSGVQVGGEVDAWCKYGLTNVRLGGAARRGLWARSKPWPS